MRIAMIVLTSIGLDGSLLSSVDLSRAEPVQTESRLTVPGGECIKISRNLVGIVTVAGVRNTCDEPFTVVLYTGTGPEIINVPPHVDSKWNTTLFSRWKVCRGISNPSC